MNLPLGLINSHESQHGTFLCQEEKYVCEYKPDPVTKMET